MRNSVNLRQIEAFYSVMRIGTVVGAAKMMSVTQPAISRAIAHLEIRIGYKLFERTGRKLVATPEAQALYSEIEPIYGSLDRIAQVAYDIGHQRSGALRVATLPAMSQSLIPRTIARFLATRPQVTVLVQTLPSRQIAAMVAGKQFDVGVVELPLSQPSISIEPLEPFELALVMPADHRLASKRRISLKELDGERMILLSQQSYMRYQIDDAFSILNVFPNVVMETPNSLVACASVAAGVGITLVTRFAAEPFITSNVVMRPIAEELHSRSAVIFPYPGKRLSLAETFVADLRDEIRKKS
ncbi:DNA-binding transcriptional LysR family regulator [Herbaspirillum sp. Sphag1AN]|uniref:LysR family transcriptional regulator n=1 Tax=unclassified Herbaspirillum TaxID=2624150 RepID=UPI0017EFA9B5|nr:MULTISPECIES: LysR family transcriptional regulator [unclassified Herbaspirillum]MBB3212443.1 DNA-binding transcriptional LysR family regulator [Herbaspirillum sp. Sphag1AN]MBB3245458.1 DNA-binding transcriptional LysR family regulator [Herbaspirillum sp. Sphag64]